MRTIKEELERSQQEMVTRSMSKSFGDVAVLGKDNSPEGLIDIGRVPSAKEMKLYLIGNIDLDSSKKKEMEKWGDKKITRFAELFASNNDAEKSFNMVNHGKD